MKTLMLDTTSNQHIKIGLRIAGKKFTKEQKIQDNKTQVVLPMIDSILKEHRLSLQDLNAIEVNIGPGSFTGIRVGISIANVLSFVLKIPVNNLKIGDLAQPLYE